MTNKTAKPTAKIEGLYYIIYIRSVVPIRYVRVVHSGTTSTAKMEGLCDITGYENNLVSWPISIYVGL